VPENVGPQNRYQLGEVLGRGGMGVVYRAYDTQLRREVALKTLLDVDNAAALELFHKEWGLLAAVVHPNIVEIYDVGEFEQDGVTRPFFVMPLLRGVTLEQLIRERSPRLELPKSIGILAQAARGLHAAHELGLIHRDLKPSNVFVMDDDSVKLIDFGIARLARVASGTALKGTIHYMAPELFELKPPSPASDLFSLAVVCYETLAGRQPFQGATDNEVIAAVLHQSPPALSEVNPNIHYAVSQVVHRGLAKQPWQRFSSVREFGDALQKALRNETLDFFDPATIQPRLDRVSRACEQDDYEFASELLAELEGEGRLDPKITRLRREIDQALRQGRLRKLLHASRRFLEAGEYPPALRKVQEALEADPENPEALALKSQIETARPAARPETERDALKAACEGARRQLEAGDCEAALATCRQYLERFPGHALFLALQREAEAKQRQQAALFVAEVNRRVEQEADPEKRVRILEKALAEQPGDPLLEKALALAREQREMPPATPPEPPQTLVTAEIVKSLFEQAQRMAEGDPEGAEAALDRILALEPQHAGARRLRERIGAARPPETPPEAGARASEVPRAAPPAAVRPPLPPGPAARRWLVAAALATVFLVSAALMIVLMRTKRTRAPAPVQTRLVSLGALPSGATILVNGEVCGVSQCEPRLPPGVHKVEARLAGYETAAAELTVGAQGAAPLVLSLAPLGTLVRLTSDQENAAVLLDEQPAGRIQNGEFELRNLTPGAHTLTVLAPGGRATLSFETAAASPPWLRAPLEAGGLRTIVVAALGPSARVWANLRDREATLDGQPAGTLAAEGLLLSNLAEGAHELALGQSKILLAGETGPTLTAFIGSDTSLGSLRILTGEDGAAVYLNGQRHRRSTQKGRLLLSLAPKKYAVRVTKEGFLAPPEQTVEVKRGEEARLEFKLTPAPKFAALRLRNSTPGAEVLVDGNPAGVIGADGGFGLPKLDPPGKHSVVVRKDAYKERRFEMDFEVGATVELEAALESLLGTLRIEASPPLPEIRLALRREGEPADRPVAETTLQVPEGTYRLSGTAAGYQPGSTTVRVAAGRAATAALALKKIEAKPAVQQPVLTLADWEKAGGWTREGGILTRRGGNVVVAPLAPMAGSYHFTILLQRGSRLEWLVAYQDDRNYIQYQLDKNNFSRAEILNGRRSNPARTPHGVDRDSYVSVQIDVSKEAVRHRIRRGEKWEFLDEFRKAGGDLLAGPFAFRVGGRDQIALSEFRFVPR
jgi:serine/threonine protein kinase